MKKYIKASNKGRNTVTLADIEYYPYMFYWHPYNSTDSDDFWYQAEKVGAQRIYDRRFDTSCYLVTSESMYRELLQNAKKYRIDGEAERLLPNKYLTNEGNYDIANITFMKY